MILLLFYPKSNVLSSLPCIFTSIFHLYSVFNSFLLILNIAGFLKPIFLLFNYSNIFSLSRVISRFIFILIFTYPMSCKRPLFCFEPIFFAIPNLALWNVPFFLHNFSDSLLFSYLPLLTMVSISKMFCVTSVFNIVPLLLLPWMWCTHHPIQKKTHLILYQTQLFF